MTRIGRPVHHPTPERPAIMSEPTPDKPKPPRSRPAAKAARVPSPGRPRGPASPKPGGPGREESRLQVALRRLVARDGRDQVALAAASGVAQASISYALNGREPRLETLVRLARAMGVGPHELGRLLMEAYPDGE